MLQILVKAPAWVWRPGPYVVLVPIELTVVALRARWLEIPPDPIIQREFSSRLERVLNVDSVVGL